MKPFLILFLISIIIPLNSFGQYDYKKYQGLTIEQNDIYKAKIHFNNDTIEMVKGALFDISDSSVVLSNSFDYMDYRLRKFTTTEYPIIDIKQISVRKNDQLKRSTLKGGMIGGLSLGGLTFLIFAADKNASQGAFLSGITAGALGYIGGAIIGFGVGTIHLKIPINDNFVKFRKKQNALRKRTIKTQSE
ncbi:hypothetical protein ACE01N_20485 [Saccharicrinis sp. FJH2]|uniref:hypothetical protein n=1 Tax=Saccharicrinis sp. FJH65 TaxID=3344659 RepID=UPI0035F25A6A